MNRALRTVSLTVFAGLALFVAGCGGPTLFDQLGRGWSLGICGTLIVILDILALVEIAGASWTFGRKALWALLIVFFPFGGLILYWLFGRPS
jgi:hypothetical protein